MSSKRMLIVSRHGKVQAIYTTGRMDGDVHVRHDDPGRHTVQGPSEVAPDFFETLLHVDHSRPDYETIAQKIVHRCRQETGVFGAIGEVRMPNLFAKIVREVESEPRPDPESFFLPDEKSVDQPAVA